MQRWFWPVLGMFSLALVGCSGSDVIVRKQVEMEGTLDRLTQENAALNTRVTRLGDSLKDVQTQMKAAAGDPEVFNRFRAQVQEMYQKLAELDKGLLQVQQAQAQQAATVQQLTDQKGPHAATPVTETAPAPSQAPAASESHAAAAAAHAEAKPAPAKEARKRPAKEAYAKAFALFNAKNYSGAAEAFETMVKDEPASTLAPNAYYWAGECYYSQKRYARALESFSKVVSDYPKADKVPDALLKIGFTHISLKEQAKAKSTLKSLVEKYPKSAAAAKARERLAHL